jgi:hypothetical protein
MSIMIARMMSGQISVNPKEMRAMSLWNDFIGPIMFFRRRSTDLYQYRKVFRTFIFAQA